MSHRRFVQVATWCRDMLYCNPQATLKCIGMSLSMTMLMLVSTAEAQFNNGNRQGVVGGVKIDAQGVVLEATQAERQEFLQGMRAQFRGASEALAKKADLRMVSLKGVQQQIAKAAAAGKTPSEDVLFLGGLTRIEYVFVYPDQNDIVIAGPAEDWKVSDQGVMVGKNSGRPVLCLDDLLTAVRSVETARADTISVSIDPTQEGIARLQQVQKQVPNGADPRSYDSAMKDAFGPQKISLTGVPPDSHLASVLLVADYQMKRYGMDLIKSPVRGLPSYLEMVGNRSGAGKLQSRWWMSCDYNSIEHSEDGLAWHISGRGIKTNTEQEMVDSQGKLHATDKVDTVAKKWANVFDEKLDELSLRDPVFGELRNVMDLCVLAALIESKGLAQNANCDLSVLKGKSDSIELASFGTPKTLPPQSSFVRVAGAWTVSLSGGVLVDSWQVAERTQVNNAIVAIRQKSQPADDSWHWGS